MTVSPPSTVKLANFIDFWVYCQPYKLAPWWAWTQTLLKIAKLYTFHHMNVWDQAEHGATFWRSFFGFWKSFQKVPRGTPGGLFKKCFRIQKRISRMLPHVPPDPKRSYDGEHIVLHFSTKFGVWNTKALACRAGNILKNWVNTQISSFLSI